MADPTNSELARQITTLEERMNTHQAEYKTDIAQLSGDTRSAIERLRADMASRETRIILAVFGAAALATAVLGFLIRMPAGTA